MKHADKERSGSEARGGGGVKEQDGPQEGGARLTLFMLCIFSFVFILRNAVNTCTIKNIRKAPL